MANKVYFFDKNYQETNIDEAIYAFIGDVEEFRKICDNMECLTRGVREVGIYKWSEENGKWEMNFGLSERKIVNKKAYDIIGYIKDIFTGWNISITLNTNETIKINSEPIQIAEIEEVINTMLKPNFFGERIKKFEIVAE